MGVMETTILDNVALVKINPESLREARGKLRQSAVARQVGISRQQLWNYENGIFAIPSDVLGRLCLLYEKPITFFLTLQKNLP
jgi:transcriptional regulator with XRE-family HTH domain